MERMTIRKALGDFILKVSPAKIVSAEKRLQRLVNAGFLQAEEAAPALQAVRAKLSPLTEEDIAQAAATIRSYYSDDSEESGDKKTRVSFKMQIRNAINEGKDAESVFALCQSLLSNVSGDLERASLTETLAEAVACNASDEDLVQAVRDYEEAQERKRVEAQEKVKAAK